MILLTGATGAVGRALLARLLAAGRPVRCLVRDPRRLGDARTRVHLALGDLADPHSFRNALRGAKVLVHLAGTRRDQRRGSIEELNGIATWRLVEAARRTGVEHVVLLSALGASGHDRTRFLRAKALAEEVVAGAGLPATVLAPSLVLRPRDPFWGRLMLLPAVPVAGRGRARFAPIAADDVAACALAALDRPGGRHELCGPEVLSRDALLRLAVRRPLVALPPAIVERCLRGAEAVLRTAAPVTWDEAELLEVPAVSARGTADALALGVDPRPPAVALGLL